MGREGREGREVRIGEEQRGSGFVVILFLSTVKYLPKSASNGDKFKDF